MFDLSSSSSDGEGFKKKDKMKTKTITVVYAEAPRLDNVILGSDDYLLGSNDESSLSSSSLPTPTTIDSNKTLMNRLDQEKKKEKFFGYYPTWREMSLNDGIKVTTLEYFCNHKVFQLFNFLMTHLLAETPEDPVPFLLSLVDRCIKYRDEGGEPPLVFKDDHIRSIYVSMDPLLEGSISYNQYLVGMQTLGLTEFNIIPNEMDMSRNVAKDMFIQEAKQALLNQLDLILGKGRDTSSLSGERFQNVVEYENILSAEGNSKSRDDESIGMASPR